MISQENIEKKLREIEKIRTEMHEQIDRKCDMCAKCIMENTEYSTGENISSMALGVSFHIFKGKKPVSVTFPSGKVVITKTWRELVGIILKNCASDQDMLEKLRCLCESASGKKRIILSTHADRMNIPIKISEDIYFEGKYDTESLLYVLCKRVLRVIGYNYENIIITYKI